MITVTNEQYTKQLQCSRCTRSYMEQGVQKCRQFNIDALVDGIERVTNFEHMGFILNNDTDLINEGWECSGFKPKVRQK